MLILDLEELLIMMFAWQPRVALVDSEPFNIMLETHSLNTRKCQDNAFHFEREKQTQKLSIDPVFYVKFEII